MISEDAIEIKNSKEVSLIIDEILQEKLVKNILEKFRITEKKIAQLANDIENHEFSKKKKSMENEIKIMKQNLMHTMAENRDIAFRLEEIEKILPKKLRMIENNLDRILDKKVKIKLN